MKKLSILSLVIVLGIFVAACAPTETEPGVGTPIPPVETAPPGFGQTPGPVDPADQTPVAPDATPVDPDATPVDPDTTPVAVEDPGDSPRRASNLMNVQVRNYQDETLGDVDEIILRLDGQAGQTSNGEGNQASGQGEEIAYVVVGIGGFLGIGERHVALPFDALELVRETDDPSDYNFYVDATREQLEALPEIDYRDLDFTTRDWDVRFRNAWQAGAVVTDQAQATPAAPADQTAMPADVYRHVQAIRVSELLGATVYDEVVMRDPADPVDPAQPADPATPADPGQPGQPADPATPADPAQPAQPADPAATANLRDADRLGHVEDLIVDYETGTVEYAIVEADNALDLTDPWIPVPVRALNVLVERDRNFVGITTDYIVQADRQQLVQAPAFEVGVLPIVEDPNWDTGVRDYWLVQ
jgi:sporulation protein YlmC with PRC-barrel domain